MLGKLFNLCLHPSASGNKALQQQNGASEKIGAFYTRLSEGLNKLEVALGPESEPSFSLAWLSLAVDFVHSMHSDVMALLEELWIPARTTIGIDVLNMYLDASMRLLDICNYLKDAIGQLESYQMSLEHALSSLASAVENLSVHDDSKGLGSLQACKDELERVESKKLIPTLWADFSSKLDQGGASNSSVKRELLLRRSQSVLTSPSLDKKGVDISLVMVDVQVVTLFMSCLLLWVLTGSSEDFKSTEKLDGHAHTASGEEGWSGSISRLKERAENSPSVEPGDLFHHVKTLKEVLDVRDSIFALQGKIETSWKTGGPGKDWLDECSATLEQTRGKLADIVESSEALGALTSATFSEILSSRRKLLDFVENQLARFPTL